jgi:hypothetical protein
MGPLERANLDRSTPENQTNEEFSQEIPTNSFIFTATDSSFRYIFSKQKAIHIRKFSLLNNNQLRITGVLYCIHRQLFLGDPKE